MDIPKHRLLHFMVFISTDFCSTTVSSSLSQAVNILGDVIVIVNDVTESNPFTLQGNIVTMYVIGTRHCHDVITRHHVELSIEYNV